MNIEVYDCKIVIHVYPAHGIAFEFDPEPGEEIPEEEKKPKLAAVARKAPKKRVNEK